jgi:hypothetical protein
MPDGLRNKGWAYDVVDDGGLIRIRAVRNKGWAYNVVVWRGGICMPFTPTHMECITPEDNCLGMHGGAGTYGKGMLELPYGYDRDDIYVMRDGRLCELVVDLPCTKAQEVEFYRFMRASIGEPYDWSAPWGFLLGGHHHKKWHSMCSAKVVLGLRDCGYFRWPLTKPAHEIDPAEALALLSICVEIEH